MGIPTLLDTVVLAPAAILGLLGVWLGFMRSLVSWPMRWLLPLFGAGVAALLAALYLIVNSELAGLLYLSGTVGSIAVVAVASLVTFVLLSTFMRNLKDRVAVWAGNRRIGLMARAFGGLVGIACGLLLAAIPYALYESMQPGADNDPAWVRESRLLPYFRSAADLARRAAPLWPRPDGRP